jgi:diguanylate cyclase (GGDEF)-like protein
MTRLNEIRQLSNELEIRLKRLLIESKGVKLRENADAVFLTNKLNTILLGNEGLLPTRMQEFRSIGQATGRSNFVRNLVGDYARQIQFYSYEISEAVITETESTAKRINQQTQVIGYAAIFAVIFLITVVYFVRRKIILRLVKLKQNVLLRLKGVEVDLNLKGNDEISDIATSFNTFAEQIEEQKQSMQALSLTDGLTGIPNRRFLDERLTTEIQIAKRHQWPLSLLIMDVDSFKNFNDFYGHLEGDDCLKKIAQALTRCKQRNSDFVARFGGEEFVLILPDTSIEGAEQVASMVLKAIYDLHIAHEKTVTSDFITLSIGISCWNYQQPVNEDELLEQADKALYQAKNQGKNCFVSFKQT